MGVIYFLICVRKHKSRSNLPTNICATSGKKTQWYAETIFLPYFMTVQCVFFYQSVCFFTNGVCHVFHQKVCFYVFCKTVLVKKYTPCQGMI